MKILRLIPSKDSDEQRPSLIVVFGVGLVGSAIVSEILKSRVYTEEVHPFSWDRPDRQAAELELIVDTIESSRQSHGGRAISIDLIWSAGKSGFACSRQQAEQELRTYRDVTMYIMRRLARLDARVNMNLTSSIGGLFEGAGYVDADTIPRPKRPYGWLKMEQERELDGLPRVAGVRIFRLASVYGFISNRYRMGLVPTLIRNGLRHRVTPIFGRFETLRDYVWARDVAGFVAASVLRQTADGRKEHYALASFRPRSVYEVKAVVEKVLRKRIYVAVNREPTNTGNITLSPKLRPAGLACSPLELNAREIAIQAMRTQRFA